MRGRRMASAGTFLLQLALSAGLILLGMMLHKPIWRRTRNRWTARLPLIAALVLAAIALAWSFGLFSGAACDATADPDSCGPPPVAPAGS